MIARVKNPGKACQDTGPTTSEAKHLNDSARQVYVRTVNTNATTSVCDNHEAQAMRSGPYRDPRGQA